MVYNELHQVNMVYFMMDGQFDVGYEINRIKFFKMRYQGNF